MISENKGNISNIKVGELRSDKYRKVTVNVNILQNLINKLSIKQD